MQKLGTEGYSQSLTSLDVCICVLQSTLEH